MQPQHTLFAIFAVLVGCSVFVAWYMSEAQRVKRGLASAQSKSVSELREGDLVRVVGTLKLGPRTLTAPLSGRTCALYFVRVREQRGKSSVEVIRESEGVEFMLDDGTGAVLVRPERFELALVEDHDERSGTWNDASPEVLKYLASKGQSPENMLGFNRGLQFHEGVLEEGERVAVLAAVKVELDPAPTTAGDGYRDRAMRKVLVTPPSGAMLLSDEPGATA